MLCIKKACFLCSGQGSVLSAYLSAFAQQTSCANLHTSRIGEAEVVKLVYSESSANCQHRTTSKYHIAIFILVLCFGNYLLKKRKNTLLSTLRISSKPSEMGRQFVLLFNKIVGSNWPGEVEKTDQIWFQIFYNSRIPQLWWDQLPCYIALPTILAVFKHCNIDWQCLG